MFQPLHRLVDFALALVGGGPLLARFVLVLLEVQLEIEHVFEIAPAAASATAPAAAAAEGDLDLAESGLGAQNMLQRALLGGQGLAPALRFELSGGRVHVGGGLVHVLREAVEFLVDAGKLATAHAPGERLRLVAQLTLHVG